MYSTFTVFSCFADVLLIKEALSGMCVYVNYLFCICTCTSV